MPKPVGRRPVVLLSRDSAYGVRTAVTVANVDDLTTIPTSCIKRRIVMLSADKMRRIEHAIRFTLDLP